METKFVESLVKIDNEKIRKDEEQTREAFLFQEQSQPHLLEIEYRQETGNYALDLRWNRITNLTTNVTFDRIPASNLFTLIPFANSPYETVAQPTTESGKCATNRCV